jgi:hypothetical protein
MQALGLAVAYIQGIPVRYFSLDRACRILGSSTDFRPQRMAGVHRISSVRSVRDFRGSTTPHSSFGLHKRVAKRVHLSVNVVGVEDGLGDFFTQELRVPTAKAKD